MEFTDQRKVAVYTLIVEKLPKFTDQRNLWLNLSINPEGISMIIQRRLNFSATS